MREEGLLTYIRALDGALLLAPAQHEFRDDPGAYTPNRLFTFVHVQALPGSWTFVSSALQTPWRAA